MAGVSAKMVKELRDQTGVGMMDCKKALEASDGDMAAAIEFLRKAGMAKAEKKAGRAAREGVIVSRIEDGVGVLAEVLCETDFVAKTDDFKAFAGWVAERGLEDFDVDGDIGDALAEAANDELTALVGKIGENMQIRRAVRWTTDATIGSYLHMGGRIGVMVEAEGPVDDDLLSNICMHVAAFNPTYISPDDVPEDVVAKEKEIAAAQVEGKPENIIDKIVTGKLNKWYTQCCLTRQPWVRDDKKTLAKLAPEVTVQRFVRWEVGEDI